MATIPPQIQPADEDDRKRWDDQAQRIRILEGAHEDDVRDDIRSMFALEIAVDLEISPDLSRNTFLLVSQQLNTAYSKPPDVRLSEDADLSPIVTPRLWPQQVQTGLYVQALNETLVRVDWAYWDGATEATYRTVPPDTVVLTADPQQPDRPVRVEEVRPRQRGDGTTAWTWDVWDVSDPAAPIYRIDVVDDRGVRHDATAQFSPELAGSYPYRDTSGAPVLPYVLYHQRVGSSLWAWRRGVELVRGTLRLCSLWSHWTDGFNSCAHPQRYALDVGSQAGITKNVSGVPVEVIPTDRKSILKFTSTGATGGTLSQFSAAMEPRSAAEALKTYEQGLATYAGLNPSDLQVTSAQSGYAIVVSREGQRRKQRALEPSLRMGDQELLSKAARLANAYGSAGLPENPRDYSIQYHGVGETEQERKAKIDTITAELQLGLISRIDGIRRLHPEITSDEDAVERLLAVDRIDEIMAAAATGPDDVGGAPSLGGATKAQDTALNGAQVSAAQGIVQAVALDQLPRDAGISMLANFFNLPTATATDIMGSVGTTFTPPRDN